MKKLFAIVAVLTALHVSAQVPDKISFQAVIRDNSNNLLINQPVGIQISILQGSVSGMVVFVETHNLVTNSNGLASLEIGAGSVVSGNFSAIDWSGGPFFLKTETDPTGGTSYTITGTSQLLSVPFALHAKTAETVTGTIQENDPVFNNSAAAVITSADISVWNNKSDFSGNYSDLSNKPDSINDFVMDAGAGLIRNVADPKLAQDAATKAYVNREDSTINAYIAGLVERIEILEGKKVKDASGNIYTAVTIGNQVWMAENLRTNKLNDGTPIVLQPLDDKWMSLTTPGYSWYNNDSATNYTPYGALYNFHAVSSGKLCPLGWHVPTLAEWDVLNGFLGGVAVVGGKIKEAGTAHWLSPNTDATNETGFTALPGGYRANNGIFGGKGQEAYFWTSTMADQYRANLFILSYMNGSIMESAFYFNSGASVRCVKD